MSQALVAMASVFVAIATLRAGRPRRCREPPTPPPPAPEKSFDDFFAKRDADGNLSVDPSALDTFLSWECGRRLVDMDMFPDTKEITESMACLNAVRAPLSPAPAPLQAPALEGAQRFAQHFSAAGCTWAQRLASVAGCGASRGARVAARFRRCVRCDRRRRDAAHSCAACTSLQVGGKPWVAFGGGGDVG